MSLNAEILGVGPFSTDLLPHLPHPADLYSGTRNGSIIMVPVIPPMTGSSKSRDLAACFGIDVWDFNQHKLDPKLLDLDKLRLLIPAEDVARFIAFASHNFEFYFMPNG